MTIQLTDSAIRKATKQAAAEQRRIDLIDGAHAGLRLRVTPAGTQSWVLCCRDPLGRMRRFPLGSYADLGIAKARDAAQAMRVRVREGADPVADSRRQRAIGRDARAGIGTLAALLDLYAKHHAATLKSWPECRRRIEPVFSKHLKSPLAVLKAGDAQLAADVHPSKQSAAAAVRYLRPVLKWASQAGRQYAPRELTDLVPPATVARRQRVLQPEERARLLPVLRASDSPYAAALQLMLLTGCRREEACAACWRDVDFQVATWRLPETKNGRKHVIPVSRQVMALLRSRHEIAAVMPKKAPEEGKPSQIRDMLIFTSRGGRLANWDRATKSIMEGSHTAGWHRHDLRRTAATLMGQMGTEPHVIEAALNHAHVGGQLAATYNRSRYLPQVADALQRLADALDGIAATKPAVPDGGTIMEAAADMEAAAG